MQGALADITAGFRIQVVTVSHRDGVQHSSDNYDSYLAGCNKVVSFMCCSCQRTVANARRHFRWSIAAVNSSSNAESYGGLIALNISICVVSKDSHALSPQCMTMYCHCNAWQCIVSAMHDIQNLASGRQSFAIDRNSNICKYDVILLPLMSSCCWLNTISLYVAATWQLP